MKKFLIMLLTALMVLSFTGCNKPQEEEKASEIVFWHTLTDHDEQMVREIVDAFNAEYEGKSSVITAAG